MVAEPLDKMSKHSDAFLWVNDLIIDLKLQLAGMEPTERFATGCGASHS